MCLAMYGNPDVKFGDGTPVNKVQDAIYLGVKISRDMDINKEITQRIQNVMITLKN